MTRGDWRFLCILAAVTIASSLAFVYEVAFMEDHTHEPTMENHQ